jgi:NitT/TauT family transport system permease protein
VDAGTFPQATLGAAAELAAVSGPPRDADGATARPARPTWSAVALPVAGDLLRRWGVRLLALLAGLLFWHWATAVRLDAFVRFENVPSPESVAAAFARHLAEPAFYLHVLVSLRRILIGYLLAGVLGVGLGVAVGRSRLARDLVTPYVELLRPIPAVARIRSRS